MNDFDMDRPDCIGRGIYRRGDGSVREFTGDGTDGLLGFTQIRVPAEVRASWPEARQTREQEAWEALVEADVQYQLLLKRGRLSWLLGSPEDEAGGRRQRARKRYKRVVRLEENRERRVPPAVRRAVMAEWEATGRVCIICGEAVAPDEPTHIHHIRPVSHGGTRERENLRVAHARCNLRRGDNRFWWVLGQSTQQAPCAICGRQTTGAISVRFAGETRASVHLCSTHKNVKTARGLIDLDQISGMKLLGSEPHGYTFGVGGEAGP